MTKNERIMVLKKFHICLRVAEHKKTGYESCMYKGMVESTECLLIDENGLTRMEVDMLRKCFDDEIKKAGIESDQFVALYHTR